MAIVNGSDNNDFITLAGAYYVKGSKHISLPVTTTNGGDTVDAGKGDDYVETGGGNDSVFGGKGKDTLLGQDGADHIDGGEGKDTLVGGRGADYLDGGDGADTADYADSSDAVQVSLTTSTGIGGDAEGDTLVAIENLTGSAFGDWLAGDASTNTLDGGSGDDRLFGDAGADTLLGGAGADLLAGQSGVDMLTGGAGADRFFMSMSDGNGDRITDYEYGEQLWLYGAPTSLEQYRLSYDGTDSRLDIDADGVGGFDVSVVLSGYVNGVLSLSGQVFGTDTYQVVSVAKADAIYGTQGADTLFASNYPALTGPLYMYGLRGDDLLNGGLLADQIDGGSGDDRLFGNAGADTLLGGAGADLLAGQYDVDDAHRWGRG